MSQNTEVEPDTTAVESVVETLLTCGRDEPLTPGLARSMRAILFGHMVRRATPVMAWFQSDLYHDANWLTENVTGPITFDWAVYESGTSVGDSARYIATLNRTSAVLYSVEVSLTGGRVIRWQATFTQLSF